MDSKRTICIWRLFILTRNIANLLPRLIETKKNKAKQRKMGRKALKWHVVYKCQNIKSSFRRSSNSSLWLVEGGCVLNKSCRVFSEMSWEQKHNLINPHYFLAWGDKEIYPLPFNTNSPYRCLWEGERKRWLGKKVLSLEELWYAVL